MLKILLILSFLLTLFAENISWHSNYDLALNQAKKEEKNIMLFLASSQNQKSREVLAKYFLDKEYINYLNKNFISVLIMIESKNSYPIEMFYTKTYPSLFFISYKDESFLAKPIKDFSQDNFEKTLFLIKNKLNIIK